MTHFHRPVVTNISSTLYTTIVCRRHRKTLDSDRNVIFSDQIFMWVRKVFIEGLLECPNHKSVDNKVGFVRRTQYLL